MILSKLDWDSEFFGLSVCRLEIDSEDDPNLLESAVSEHDFSLCYVVVPEVYRDKFASKLSAMGAACLDNKTTYVKEWDSNWGKPVTKVTVAANISSGLKELALASGWCSRFNCDLRLYSHFNRLYLTWLERDFTAKNSAVLEINEEGIVHGMVTVTYKFETGKIGLIAVREASRGMGYGSALIKAAENYCCDQGVKKMEVVTQGNNKAACRLYEACGYCVDNIVDVWHLWRDES